MKIFHSRSYLFFFILLIISCNNRDNINYIEKVDALNARILTENFDNKPNSLQVIDSVFSVLAEIDYPKGLSDAYARKGLYFENKGEYDSAYNNFLISTDIRKRIGDKKLIAFGFTNLAETAQSLKNWNLSKKYLDTAWVLFHEVNDTIYLMKINQQFGKFYAEQVQYDIALPYFLRGYQYALQNGDIESLNTFSQSLGNVYGSIQKYDSSNYYYNVWRNYIDSNNLYELYEYSCCISSNFIENNELNKAEKEIKQAKMIFESGQIDTVDLIYLLARENELAFAQGNFKDAYITQQKLMDIQNQYLELNTANQIAEMDIKYKTEEKEAINQLLEMKNKQKSFLIILLSISSIILLFLGLFVVKNMRQKQIIIKQQLDLKENEIKEMMQSKELETFDAALRGQDQERSRIAQELHDRLGSILSIAKLNFETLKIDTQTILETNKKSFEQISEMLQMATDEVRKISHDLFANTLANFGIETALIQISEAISRSNQIKVNFIYKNLPQNMSQDLQINIYRIAQELLTNSIKHGKPQNIYLQLIGLDNNTINLSYEEDGSGFDVNKASKGLGFKNIEARIKKFDGNYEIESKANNGMLFSGILHIKL